VNSDSSKLEQRLGSALSNGSASSADLMELIAEANAAAEAAEQDAAAARERALDLTASDLDTAHTTLVGAELSRDRLQAVLPKLRSRLTEALGSEAHARWRGDFERTEKRRDEAAAKFAQQCPELLASLVGLMREAEAVDQDCLRVNALAPASEPRRLVGVELSARGMDAYTATQPSISQTIRLPDWQHSDTMAWPMPQPDFAATYAALTPVIRDIRHTADWWQAAAQDATERRQIAERRAREQEAATAQARAAYEQTLVANERERERRARLRQRGHPDMDTDGSAG
jgi:hypothetical protein